MDTHGEGVSVWVVLACIRFSQDVDDRQEVWLGKIELLPHGIHWYALSVKALHQIILFRIHVRASRTCIDETTRRLLL